MSAEPADAAPSTGAPATPFGAFAHVRTGATSPNLVGHGGVPHADVVIVGAGFAGIGLGIRMLREGRRDVIILERADAVGGTWRDNTYPGVACDIPSQLYCFSFRPKPDWSRLFAPGAEIAAYLREAVRDEGLEPSIHLSTALLEARWDARHELWRLTTSRGPYTARVLVTAAGRLAEPRLSAVDGLSTFAGEQFHTARWRHDVELGGKRVGVVGTGASAVQLVPRIAQVAASVVVFQRSAPYVVPRGDRAITAAERAWLAGHPEAVTQRRADLFAAAEAGFAQKAHGSVAADRHRALALTHLAAQVPDPELRRRLTPDYEIGCKRVLISDDFYPSLGRPHVTLEPSALARVDGRTAIATSGDAYDLDVLVFATGFETTDLPFARLIVGRDGERLADHWMHGMTAFASTTVHGFPNLYLIDGPLASLGHNSAIEMIETQISYILGALGDPRAVLEVSAVAEREYTAELDRRSTSTVWLQGGCTSWYLDARSGRQTLLWPGTAASFRARNGVFNPAPYLTANTKVQRAAAGTFGGTARFHSSKAAASGRSRSIT